MPLLIRVVLLEALEPLALDLAPRVLVEDLDLRGALPRGTRGSGVTLTVVESGIFLRQIWALAPIAILALKWDVMLSLIHI